MEGLKIIEKSYFNLKKFRDVITNDSFSSATQLNIIMTNYDMQTQQGIKDAVTPVLDVYKDELEIDNVYRFLSGDTVRIKIPNEVEGFRDDLIDALKNYIDRRSSSLFSIISNSSYSGGLYGV